MGTGVAILETIGQAVWRASWQASVLAVAVLAAVTLCRGRLSPAWRYALWSLVLVRLLLPVVPPARWSPYHLAGSAASSPILLADVGIPSPISGSGATAGPALVESASDRLSEGPPLRVADPSPSERSPAFASWRVAASIWFLGVFAMTAWIGACTWRLSRTARTWPEVVDLRVLELLADCRRRLGLRRQVRICAAPNDIGPAVVGAWRPRIVLPEAVLNDFEDDRLVAILLHELAHVRRRDVVIHWLMLAARMFHWFNPIAWLALSRMEAEREQACDDVAIDVLGPSSRQLYGQTVLRLLERLVVRPTLPGVVHFFGSRRRLRTRLESLTRTRRLAGHGRTIAIALLLGLAILGLTDSVGSRTTARGPEAAPIPRSAEGRATPQADVRLQGRVLDHLGKPVPGAEVILLAGETLTVYATPEHPNPQVRRSWSTQPAATPPTVKTDEQGRFTLRRPGSAANRVAVVSERMLLWEMPLDRIPDTEDAAITLPEPGAIRIHCDIPRKSAQQEFQVFLRTFDGVDWKPDIIYLRNFDVPNPGELRIAGLPPAQYIVERANKTDRGTWGVLMTLCERTLLPVASGKTTDVTFDRKMGRPVAGHVRGLEDVDLRFADVSIGYLGPEEAPSPRGDRVRFFTHLDRIPIGRDGRFLTPPLPPGHYDLDLFALRAATLRAERQRSDFQGSTQLDVPVEGEIPRVEIVAKASRPDPRAQVPVAVAARDRTSGNAENQENIVIRALEREHEFNDPRWPFVIKARDVQKRVLIDATFKHRVKGTDEFDVVIHAGKATLRIDPRAGVLRVHFEDAEIQNFRRNKDVVLIKDRILEVPLPRTVFEKP